jgi:hypothetical protein
LASGDEDEDDDEDLSDNAIVKFCRRVLPTTSTYEGNRFWSEIAPGTATPLLLALAVVELSDVVFAVDSIPAVFGVTLDPFIIYSSNMFAIFSLRALYGCASASASWRLVRLLAHPTGLCCALAGCAAAAAALRFRVPHYGFLHVVVCPIEIAFSRGSAITARRLFALFSARSRCNPHQSFVPRKKRTLCAACLRCSFVANVMSELRFLDKAVALVLGFIGAKMLAGLAGMGRPRCML